jgi:Dyp-type peroxidase family
LVFRRLAQDRPAFEAFLAQRVAELKTDGFPGIDEEQLGSMLVGRWPSGAPLVRTPDRDDAQLAKSNDFDFQDDPEGLRCPLAAHIRKVNPRNGRADRANPLQTRILRRGIPYGPFEQPKEADRGLLFLCYQTSIVEQFEFLTQTWMNSAVAPGGGGGHDVLVGQTQEGLRTMELLRPDGSERPVTAEARWITATGGEYLFAPSKVALASLGE